MMELEIIVRAKGHHWNGGAAMTVPEPLEYAFEPLKTTDEPVMTFVMGDEVMANSEVCHKKLKVRQDAAKYIAEALTASLLAEMESHDTHNGYGK